MTKHDEETATPDEIARAKVDTMSRAQRFGGERETVLGASMWGAALGDSPFVDPVELWQQLSRLSKPSPGNEATDLGEDLEDGVARNAARRLGVARLDSPPTLRHPKKRHFVATPDRIVTELGPNAAPGVSVGDLLQIKTTYVVRPARRAHIDRLWGEPGTADVPEHVLEQCIGELWIARAWAEAHPKVWGFDPPERNHVAALIGGRGVQLYCVPWDPELAALLVARLDPFWAGVIDGEPPPLDESEAWAKELQRQHPEHSAGVWRVGDSETAEILRRFVRSKAIAEDAATVMAAAENLLRARIGEAEGLRGPWGNVPWRARAARSTFDKRGMAARLLHLTALLHDAADYLDDVVENPGAFAQDAVSAMVAAIRDACPIDEGIAARAPVDAFTEDDVDAAVEAFTHRGERSRNFGPVEVNRHVLDLTFPPSPKTEAAVDAAVATEVWAVKPVEEKAAINIRAALEDGRQLDVDDYFALPLADPTPLVSPEILERLERATAAHATKQKQSPPAQQPKPNPWTAPLRVGPIVADFLERPASCSCGTLALLSGGPGGPTICLSCGARAGDGDVWIITRKNTRPVVQRVFLTVDGEWSPSIADARRFPSELAAQAAKPRQTRVVRTVDVDALDMKEKIDAAT